MPFPSEPPAALLDAIYDSAAEPELWRSALTQIADLTGSEGGILFGQSVSASAVYFDYNGRLNENCNRAYQERHMNNPWSVAMESQTVGRTVFSDDLVPLSQLRATEFFDEVLRPQGIGHNGMIALAAREDFRVAFNICRSERRGPFSEDDRRFFEWLSPHLRRSVHLGFRVQGYHALRRAEYGVLDQFASGVILIDRQARIVYVNAAAQSHASEDGALVLRGQGVTTRSPEHARRLEALIRAALQGTPASMMSAPRRSDGRQVVMLASSVRGKDVGRFSDLGMADAAALLFIVDPADRAATSSAWLMEAYGLTPAEARVALAVAEGSAIAETADRLGLSANTIKTHLRGVFAKTGVRRQAELTRLVTSINAIRGDDQA